MRKTGSLIAGLLLVFSLNATNAFQPLEPLTTCVTVQEEKKAEDQKKDEQKDEAKEDEKSEAKEEKPEEEEAVVATPALDAVKGLADAFTADTEAFMKKTREASFTKDYRAAAKDGRKAATAFLKKAGQPDRAQYAAEMEEVVAQSMAWMAANGDSKKRTAAMDYLFENYADNQAMEMVVEMAGTGVPQKKAQARFRNLIENNPSKKVKGLATMALADMLARTAKEDTTEVEALYDSVVKNYADLESRRGPIGTQAERALFAIRYLSIGKEAPDIAAEDLDGVEFKLTDYRGKVVLLDFWGNW